VLGYANGMLQNVSAHLPPTSTRLIDTALARGYLVKVDGDPMWLGKSGLLDLTNPDARAWYTQVWRRRLCA
jgi:alpha-glucosidase (family GH31 glycosyl hydrolase)